MRFIDIKEPGSPDMLFVNEGPVPEPGPNEILVQVKAAGVNRPDLYQRAGHYPPPPGASPILGLEVAGIVSKIGLEVANWKVGDAVCGLTNGGGYAEYCAVPAGQCLPLPQGLNFTEAASLPETYFTVWGNLFMRGRLKSGESVLVHGGSSGIGSCAIQLSKAFGAHVATTVGNERKAAFCKDLKADEIINYKEQDFFSLLKGKGVDVVLDIVGGEYFEKNILLLKEEGRLIQVARMQSSPVTLDLNRLLFKRLTVLGSTLRAQSSAAKAKIAQELLTQVWPLFGKKALKPVVTATYPFSNAAEAHKLMESSQHCGKIVLII
ncbi:MAG: NAD(P)H-quinone oxidoreductase [Verrucomicrobia bacterium]|nr:NAD(P)H-quinone oxidoreductase [Verrucomicrobiota bacterium]